MKPLVVVVVVNYNGGEVVMNCINSLIKVTNYDNYRIVVVDNGSTDGTLERLYAIKQVDLFNTNENIGFAPAMNVGWRYAIQKYNPEYIQRMDSDITTIQSNWLSEMVATLEYEDDYSICGNKLVFPDGRLQGLYYERLKNKKDYTEKDNGQYDFRIITKAVGGANMLIKTSVISKVGGLDENFFYGPDDIDYCFRVGKAGFNIVYNGSTKLEHIGSYSYKSSKKDFIYKHQSYGTMLFTFRYNSFIVYTKMVISQLIRVFITRKSPYDNWSIKNTYFHWSFLRRIYYFLVSFITATMDFNYIENTRFNGKQLEVKR
jgi:GT2 family glycosyltransferase